jgi:hypothetical protein
MQPSTDQPAGGSDRKSFQLTAEQTAVSYALIFLLLGTLVTVCLYQLSIKDSPTIIALLVLPLLVYGIASGKILELSVPGGWSAKFKEAAQQKIGTTATPITSDMKELQPVPKLGEEALRRVLPTLPKGKPIALILFFGRRGYQVLSLVRKYFEKLRLVDPNMVVILVQERTERFICMIEGSTFIDLLDTEKQELIDAVNDGDANYFRNINKERQNTSVIFRSLAETKTNADALREMKELNINTMAIVDGDNKPVAIVRRDEIVAHLFDELTA